MPHFMIILILYINLPNLSWIKMSSLDEYGAFIKRDFHKIKRNELNTVLLEIGWTN